MWNFRILTEIFYFELKSEISRNNGKFPFYAYSMKVKDKNILYTEEIYAMNL